MHSVTHPLTVCLGYVSTTGKVASTFICLVPTLLGVSNSPDPQLKITDPEPLKEGEPGAPEEVAESIRQQCDTIGIFLPAFP